LANSGRVLAKLSTNLALFPSSYLVLFFLFRPPRTTVFPLNAGKIEAILAHNSGDSGRELSFFGRHVGNVRGTSRISFSDLLLFFA